MAFEVDEATYIAMPKLLYLITEDWFFCSHFLERAKAAKAAGVDVVVVARESLHGDVIRSANLRFHPLKIKRQGINPLSEFITLINIWRIYRQEKPDLLHHIALKSIVYGSLCARLLGIQGIVNAPVGMGFVFSSDRLLARILRPVVTLGLRLFLSPPAGRVIFENPDDLAEFVSKGAVEPRHTRLIRGAGVDLTRFAPSAEPQGAITVVLTARMLWDKGVREFVEAAKLLRSRYPDIRFVLVGASDKMNPAAIPEQTLTQWVKDAVVEWMGHQDDIPAVLSQAHIVCLPSYREGLPKSLIEALAAGKPVVTTDVPGCREVVKHEVNGLLVPARDVAKLANALEKLIQDQELRLTYGCNGRTMAEKEFGSPYIISATLDVYAELGATSCAAVATPAR